MTDFGNKEVFSTNLKRYIEMSGKTRRDIARELGLKESSLNGWCRGEYYPRIDNIEILADYFGCFKSDLIECNPNSSILCEEKKKIIEFVTNCSEKETQMILAFIKIMEGSENNE